MDKTDRIVYSVLGFVAGMIVAMVLWAIVQASAPVPPTFHDGVRAAVRGEWTAIELPDGRWVTSEVPEVSKWRGVK